MGPRSFVPGPRSKHSSTRTRVWAFFVAGFLKERSHLATLMYPHLLLRAPFLLPIWLILYGFGVSPLQAMSDLRLYQRHRATSLRARIPNEYVKNLTRRGGGSDFWRVAGGCEGPQNRLWRVTHLEQGCGCSAPNIILQHCCKKGSNPSSWDLSQVFLQPKASLPTFLTSWNSIRSCMLLHTYWNSNLPKQS